MFEHGSFEFGYFVENGDADFGFRLLGLKPAGFQFRPDDSFPAADLGLDSAALIVAAGGLPSHAPTGLYFNDALIPECWIMRKFRAKRRILWWRNNDLDRVAKSRPEQGIGGRAVVSTIRKKMGNLCVNLIQKPRQSGCFTNIILCQFRADDLAGHKV